MPVKVKALSDTMKGLADRLDGTAVLPNVDFSSVLPDGSALAYPFQAVRPTRAAKQLSDTMRLTDAVASRFAAGGGGNVNIQGPSINQVAAYENQVRNNEEMMLFYQWALNQFNLADPAQARIFFELVPELKEAQFAQIDMYAELAKKVNKIRVTGIQTRDDLMTVYKVFTGRFPQRIPELLSSKAIGSDMWGSDNSKRYAAELFNPSFWVAPVSVRQGTYQYATDPFKVEETKFGAPPKMVSSYFTSTNPSIGQYKEAKNVAPGLAYPSFMDTLSDANKYYPYVGKGGNQAKGVMDKDGNMNWWGGLPPPFPVKTSANLGGNAVDDLA